MTEYSVNPIIVILSTIAIWLLWVTDSRKDPPRMENRALSFLNEKIRRLISYGHPAVSLPVPGEPYAFLFLNEDYGPCIELWPSYPKRNTDSYDTYVISPVTTISLTHAFNSPTPSRSTYYNHHAHSLLNPSSLTLIAAMDPREIRAGLLMRTHAPELLGEMQMILSPLFHQEEKHP